MQAILNNELACVDYYEPRSIVVGLPKLLANAFEPLADLTFNLNSAAEFTVRCKKLRTILSLSRLQA
jgi:hypothetical protein